MVVLFVLIFASCGTDSKEKVINDYAELFDDLISLMATVEDGSSAEATIFKMKKLKKKLDGLNERTKKLNMTRYDFSSNEIYTTKASEMAEAMAAAFSRLDDPKTAMGIRDAMKSIF